MTQTISIESGTYQVIIDNLESGLFCIMVGADAVYGLSKTQPSELAVELMAGVEKPILAEVDKKPTPVWWRRRLFHTSV